jgi:hypothetical protein
MGIASLILRVLVATVLGAAAAGKLRGRRAYREYARSLFTAGVPRRLVAPVAAAIAAGEVLAAVLLPWPATGAAGAVLATVLLAVLTAGVSRAVRRGTTATCRCFGPSGGRLRPVHVARNITLTACAAGAAATTLAGTGTPPAASLAPALALGLAAAIFLIFIDGVVDLLRPAAPAPERGNP